jgi:type IV pilus assembly protein PilW
MRGADYQIAARLPQISRANAHGFSLVELMVAMTLSLILLGGVIAVFSSARTTYETTDRLSRIQESGRFALDSMVRDVRATGFIGCSQLAQFRSTLNSADTLLWNFARPVEGFDGQASTWVPASGTDATLLSSLTPIPDTDVLVVRIPRPGTDVARLAVRMTATNDPVTVEAAVQSMFNVGDIVMINDCTERAVFQVTSMNGNQLQHATSGSIIPGNADADLRYAYGDTTFQGGAEAIPVQTVIYYLARRSDAPADSPPSLWRRMGGNVAEELVEGVENMQLAFGQTTGNLVSYRKADAITDWNAVVSVNIALLVRSQSEYGTDRDQATYDLISPTLGTRVPAPNDRHLRQVFATAVSLRNQTL